MTTTTTMMMMMGRIVITNHVSRQTLTKFKQLNYPLPLLFPTDFFFHGTATANFFIEASLSYSDTPYKGGLFRERSVWCRDLSIWQHNTLPTDIISPVGFEDAFPLSERPQTHALDRAATGILPPRLRRWILSRNVIRLLCRKDSYKHYDTFQTFRSVRAAWRTLHLTFLNNVSRTNSCVNCPLWLEQCSTLPSASVCVRHVGKGQTCKMWQDNLKECHPRCVCQNYSRSMIKE